MDDIADIAGVYVLAELETDDGMAAYATATSTPPRQLLGLWRRRRSPVR